MRFSVILPPARGHEKEENNTTPGQRVPGTARAQSPHSRPSESRLCPYLTCAPTLKLDDAYPPVLLASGKETFKNKIRLARSSPALLFLEGGGSPELLEEPSLMRRFHERHHRRKYPNLHNVTTNTTFSCPKQPRHLPKRPQHTLPFYHCFVLHFYKLSPAETKQKTQHHKSQKKKDTIWVLPPATHCCSPTE